MPLDLLALKDQFESAIRLGEVSSVRNEIEKIKSTDIPRHLVFIFGDIARRVRSENWGLRLLRPIVRAEKNLVLSAAISESELCIYAGLLIKASALQEAQVILLQLKPTVNALTFLSQICIMQWNYDESSKYLKKIIAHKETNLYQKATAQINLAAALVMLEKFTQAQKLLSEIIKICEQEKWQLLYGNALEISAQLAVIQGNWDLSRQLLLEAESRAGQHNHYLIFIEKWRALSHLFQAPISSEQAEVAVKKIEALREKAKILRTWETVRDFDYHTALHLKDKNVLFNVYFGTPHLAYKKRIEKSLKQFQIKIPDEYFRKFSPEPSNRVLDLARGTEESRASFQPLKPGQMLHRLLNILALDFYKPIGIGELFSKLFPGEYFHPDVSHDRVSQAVKLLRKWFSENEIPLDIKVEDSRYSLSENGPYTFKILKNNYSLNDSNDVGFEFSLEKLKKKWPYQSFSPSQAALELKISASTCRNILIAAAEQNRIFKSGSGRSVRYCFEK